MVPEVPSSSDSDSKKTGALVAYPSGEQALHFPQSPQLRSWEPRSPPVGLSAEVDGFDEALGGWGALVTKAERASRGC